MFCFWTYKSRRLESLVKAFERKDSSAGGGAYMPDDYDLEDFVDFSDDDTATKVNTSIMGGKIEMEIHNKTAAEVSYLGGLT
jgi:hypothetical protein